MKEKLLRQLKGNLESIYDFYEDDFADAVYLMEDIQRTLEKTISFLEDDNPTATEEQ